MAKPVNIPNHNGKTLTSPICPPKRLRISAPMKPRQTPLHNPTHSPHLTFSLLRFQIYNKTLSLSIMTDVEVQNRGSVKSVAFTGVKPQLYVEAPKAEEAVKFYKVAFGATETGRTTLPKRKSDNELPHVVSSHLLIAGSTILVSDSDDVTVKAGGSAIAFCLQTEDVEAAISQAVAAGAVVEGEITEGEGACGGRVRKVKDPFGFIWSICESSNKCCADVEA